MRRVWPALAAEGTVARRPAERRPATRVLIAVSHVVGGIVLIGKWRAFGRAQITDRRDGQDLMVGRVDGVGAVAYSCDR